MSTIPKSVQDVTLRPLSPKQTKAMLILVSGGTITDAADGAGVTRRALYSWMSEPRFRDALKSAQNELLDAAQGRLLSGQQTALQTLESLMTGGVSESVRRSSAETWLNMLFRYKEFADFEVRLSTLERMVSHES